MSSLKSTHQRAGVPIIEGSDTAVVLSDRRHFKIDRNVLRQHSELFQRLLTKEGPLLSEQARKIGVRHYLVLQDHDRMTGEEIIPIFQRVTLNSIGQPTRAVNVIHEEEMNLDARLLDCYEKVIGSFFTNKVTLDTANIVTAFKDAMGLMDCAEYLGCAIQISPMVDNQLMSLGQSVHQAIACAPFDWIDLGCRLCSKVIFKDALIHIVGLCHKSVAGPEGISTNNNNSGGYANPHAKVESMAESVRELVYSKIADLQRECQNAEQRMATYYPAHLQRESVSGRADRDDIGRQSYSADIFAWMALSLFRHYLSQAVIAGETHQAHDGGRSFYTRIRRGGTAYLDRDNVSGFHDRFPMSSKGKAVFVNHLDSIKAAIGEFAQPLLQNESNLDLGKFPEVTWLLCTRVSHGEYPWEAMPFGFKFARPGDNYVHDDELGWVAVHP